jgi:Flp pilus assembly protein TadD
MKSTRKRLSRVFWLILSLLLLTACNSGNLKEARLNNNNQQETEEILQSTGLKVSSVEDAVLKAEKAVQDDKLDLAQLYYIKAYDLEPNNIQILQKMTDLYSQLKKYELMEVSLNLMLKQQPNDVKIMEQYGLLQLKQGKYPEAEKKLMLVAAKLPSWRAYNGLGIIANLQGDPQKAEGFFKQADKLLPNSPELLNNIGFALYSANKLTEAASYYDKALQINPAFKKTLYNYALLQACTSNYEQAYNSFASVSTVAEANNNIGYIAMMNGDYPEANHYLQEAIKTAPQFYKKANDNLMRLEILENSVLDKSAL